MAPETSSPSLHSAAAPTHTVRKRRAMAWTLGGAAGAIAVGLGVLAALRLSQRDDLPAVPDLTRQPAAGQEALRNAEAAARAWPHTAAEIATLGRLYHANGYAEEARSCWLLLAQEQPREGHWPYYLADLARTAGDLRAMMQHLEETVRLDPEYATAWLHLAEAALKTARLDDAAAAYQRRLALLPGDPYAQLGLVRVALQRGEHAEARRALKDLVTTTPEFPSGHNLYAELLSRAGDEAGAEHHRSLGIATPRFREADDPWLLELRDSCFDPRQLLVWASLEEQTKQPARARKLFERAIALAPEQAHAYVEFADMLIKRDEHAEARAVIERGINATPFHAKLHQQLSVVLRQLGDATAALANDERALEQEPQSWELLDSRGQSQSALGQLAAAEESYRAALRLAPQAVEPEINLCILFMKTGRRAEGRQRLEAALVDHPGHPKLRPVLGLMALEENRLDDAERLIRPYFLQYRENAQARGLLTQLHHRRATAAFAAGNTAAAITWCENGLRDVADAAALLGLLGQIHLEQRNLPQALKVMEAHQRFHPGDVNAVMPLASLYRQLQRPADARRVLQEARDWLSARGAEDAARTLEGMLQTLPK